MLCDSLEIEPRPNNGTTHLPLTPVGLHSDPDAPSLEDPNDLPATRITITPTTISDELKPTSTQTAATDPVTSPPVEEPDNTNSSDNDEESDSFLDEVVNTIGDTLSSIGDWVSGLFGSDDKAS